MSEAERIQLDCRIDNLALSKNIRHLGQDSCFAGSYGRLTGKKEVILKKLGLMVTGTAIRNRVAGSLKTFEKIVVFPSASVFQLLNGHRTSVFL